MRPICWSAASSRRGWRAFTEAELEAIERVMELPDVDLADWLTGRLPIPPAADEPMLRAIRAAALDRQP